ncbi:hypothetical protein X751_16565 [Mesorhizobium sp. LNJC395A00]|nr:hypothetical protein X751_16565 [Mesorhizobium sp. LNJC395A00]
MEVDLSDDQDIGSHIIRLKSEGSGNAHAGGGKQGLRTFEA